LLTQTTGIKPLTCGLAAPDYLISRNQPRCVADGRKYEDQIAPYDAAYNGTVTWAYTNPSSKCSDESGTSLLNYTFYIGNTGDIPGLNVSRAQWDTNPFYFQLKWDKTWTYSKNDPRKNTSSHMDAYFQSSTSYYVWSQPWTVSASPSASGSGYDIQGQMVGMRYNKFNGYDYEISKCSGFFSGWKGNSPYLIPQCNGLASVTMSGTVDKDTAKVTFTMTWTKGETDTFTFTGTSNNDGPTLSTGGQVPTISGSRLSAAQGGSQGVSSGSGSGAGSLSPELSLSLVIGLVVLIGASLI